MALPPSRRGFPQQGEAATEVSSPCHPDARRRSAPPRRGLRSCRRRSRLWRRSASRARRRPTSRIGRCVARRAGASPPGQGGPALHGGRPPVPAARRRAERRRGRPAAWSSTERRRDRPSLVGVPGRDVHRVARALGGRPNRPRARPGRGAAGRQNSWQLNSGVQGVGAEVAAAIIRAGKGRLRPRTPSTGGGPAWGRDDRGGDVTALSERRW
jgi:hypothetical protein